MHNTGNPLGSTQVLDLYDNSENIDYFANSQLDEHPDRFGTKRLTLAGLIKRSMALRNEINDFSGALTFKPEWTDVPMNVSEGVGGEGGALNLQAEALGNRLELLKSNVDDLFSRTVNLGNKTYGINGSNTDINGLKKAIEDANAHGLNITAPKNLVIKLVGSETITFSCSCDFNHCKLDLSEFSGKIYFTDGVDWTTYGVGHQVVAKLRNSGTLGQGVITEWNGVSEVENAFVKISTDQDFYSYRGVPQKRTELNCVTRFGQLDSFFKYPLLGPTITSVSVKKIPEFYTCVRNISISLGSNDIAQEYINLSGSLLIFENIVFSQNNIKNNLKNQTWINVKDCAYLTVKNLRFVWAPLSLATTGYTYNLSLNDSYHVTLDNVKGSGDGWGATGSNSCCIVKINNSHLSRVDFHQPFRELLYISNSKLGSWGILVSAIGDLVVENTTFNINTNININNNGFIRSRGDLGGFCDGELTLNGCKFIKDKDEYTYLFLHQASVEPKPSSSPIIYNFWRSINVNNCSTNTKLIIAPKITPTDDIKYPVKMIFNNLTKGNFFFNTEPDLKNLYPTFGLDEYTDTPIGKNFNCQISFKDVNLRRLSIVEGSNSNKFQFKITLENILSTTNDNFCPLEFRCSGVVDINNSLIEGLDFYSGGFLDKKIHVTVNGGVIKHLGVENPQPFNGKNDMATVVITNSFLYTVGDYKTFLMARLKNVTWSLSGQTTTECVVAWWDLSLAPSAAIVTSIPSGFERKNFLVLVTGFDSDKTRKEHVYLLPLPGLSNTVQINNGKSILLSVSADGRTLTATPSVLNDSECTPRSLLLY